MEYYLKEVLYDGNNRMSAMVKPREDVERIFISEKIRPLEIVSTENSRQKADGLKKIKYHWDIKRNLDSVFSGTDPGDVVYIQFPMVEHSIFQSAVFRKHRNRGVRFVLLIHDLELLRLAVNKDSAGLSRIRAILENRDVLKSCDRVIVHNEKMAQKLREYGVKDDRIVVLGIFDYLVDGFEDIEFKKTLCSGDKKVIIAGNLVKTKVGYVYDLPKDVCFNLYGVDYTGKPGGNISYKGAFLSEDLPYELEGDFGLVWDGSSSDTCEGVYGEYLRINNPHKTSLYLAMGIPVIVWENAAIADLIGKEHCGIKIGSLKELSGRLKEMDETGYNELKNNAGIVGKRLREGYYTRKAIKDCRFRTAREN